MTEEYVVLKVPGAKIMEGVLSGARTVSPNLDVHDVKVETHSLTSSDLEDARRDPESLSVAPKMPIELVRPLAADGPQAETADTGAIAWGIQAMKVDTSRFTGKGAVVAVLDTGIEAGHTAFAGRDIVQKDFTGEGDGDQNGHGTHCAGTIFGGDVDGVRIGIARGIKRALIGKVLDRDGAGSTDQILDGILWAVREGANIVSMSLGLDFPGMVKRLVARGVQIEPATSMALSAYRQNVRLFDSLAALVAAHSQMFEKAIVIAAAGNESRRPQFEIGTAPPAAADGFLSVGALGKAGGNRFLVASFSNSLPDVAGPGVDIRSAAIGGGLTALNGTSMATPHVAGVAALWLERIQETNPNFGATELEGRLVGNATSDGLAAGVRANAGAGLVVAPQ